MDYASEMNIVLHKLVGGTNDETKAKAKRMSALYTLDGERNQEYTTVV